MELEMTALQHNGTDLVPLSVDKHVSGPKWVYTVKFHPDGFIDRLKAQLVAKGYTKTYGIEYDETFSTVAKISSIPILISFAAKLDWPLYQLEVKNAFMVIYLKKSIWSKHLVLLLRKRRGVVFAN
jgi:hypothetical protein